jgi:hypothetical protein
LKQVKVAGRNQEMAFFLPLFENFENGCWVKEARQESPHIVQLCSSDMSRVWGADYEKSMGT